MEQIFQIGGAVLILVAFVAAQRNAMSPHSFAYLTLNFSGSAVLTVLALYDSDWGFFLIEVVWAAVSLWGGRAGAGSTPQRRPLTVDTWGVPDQVRLGVLTAARDW